MLPGIAPSAERTRLPGALGHTTGQHAVDPGRSEDQCREREGFEQDQRESIVPAEPAGKDKSMNATRTG